MSVRPPVPSWVTTLCIIATLAALLFNVVWDALRPDYEGSPVTFALLAFLSLLLGYRKTLRGGDEE